MAVTGVRLFITKRLFCRPFSGGTRAGDTRSRARGDPVFWSSPRRAAPKPENRRNRPGTHGASDCFGPRRRVGSRRVTAIERKERIHAMKRIFATTALSAMLATGAFAQTEAQMTEVQRFLPDTNVALLPEETIQELVTIAYGGGSFGDRQTRMRSIVEGEGVVTATFTEAQLVQISTVAPDVDVATMTDAQILQAISFVNSEDNQADAAQKIRALVESDDDAMLMLTDAEIRDIRLIAPELDLTTITEDQAIELRAALATGDRDQVMTVVESIETM
ncbi:hypothetical protein [Citreimonas sp.]|uniref:hypothetical protein n=1 Tax=Citreimonas sp. TaxID=3036715 RepID=UPI0035C7C148